MCNYTTEIEHALSVCCPVRSLPTYPRMEHQISMNLNVRNLSTEAERFKTETYFGNSVWDEYKEKEKSIWVSTALETFKTYCQTAVLHGVKYLCEPRRHYIERFTWALVLLSLVAVTGHLWVMDYSDVTRPLFITLESSNHPIWHFNFPAVTICPSGKLNRSAAKTWAQNVKLPPNMSQEQLVSILPNLLHLTDFTESPGLIELNSVLELNELKAHDVYLDLAVSCQDLLEQCRLNGVAYPCRNLFKMIRTSEGYCCSFNYFGTSKQFLLNRYHKPSYITPTSPLRLSTNGKNSGLSVLLNTNNNTFGTPMASQGVKVLLHVATNYPDHLSMERLVISGSAEDLAIYPTKIGAESDIRDVPVVRRNCYFFDEKHLRGFQEYSYKSCIFNCRIKFFTELCGCVPFYYPVHDDGIRTCSLKDVSCLTQFKYNIQILRMNLSTEQNHREEAPCGCIPQCNELTYQVATATYTMHDHLRTSKYGNLQSIENYAEVNVHFKALFGTKYQRVQHSTTYKMLANFGGLLGLFMGFSFISVFELIYSFTLRICFRVYVISKEKTSELEETAVEAYS